VAGIRFPLQRFSTTRNCPSSVTIASTESSGGLLAAQDLHSKQSVYANWLQSRGSIVSSQSAQSSGFTESSGRALRALKVAGISKFESSNID